MVLPIVRVFLFAFIRLLFVAAFGHFQFIHARQTVVVVRNYIVVERKKEIKKERKKERSVLVSYKKPDTNRCSTIALARVSPVKAAKAAANFFAFFFVVVVVVLWEERKRPLLSPFIILTNNR